MSGRYYTTSSAFLEALAEAGVRYIFANLGSDHPGIIEALAQAKAEGRSQQTPQLRTSVTSAASFATTSSTTTRFAPAATSSSSCTAPCRSRAASHAARCTWSAAGRRWRSRSSHIPPTRRRSARWRPPRFTGEVTAEIATALAGARHPLIVTSYLGRDPAAVPKLVELSELLAIPVLESVANHVNFPADHPLHAGYQFHSVVQNPVLAQADVILAIDSDVPWIPAVNRPSADAAIYCVDVDPLKSQMNMWHVPARRFAAANSRVAVEQIAQYVRNNDLADPRRSA